MPERKSGPSESRSRAGWPVESARYGTSNPRPRLPEESGLLGLRLRLRMRCGMGGIERVKARSVNGPPLQDELNREGAKTPRLLPRLFAPSRFILLGEVGLLVGEGITIH